MSGATPSPGRVPRLSAALREGETVKPLELFFDLVFVLGFTQCSALMAAKPTWEGIGRGMLVLAVLWWAWVGYAWLTSVIDPEEGAVRGVVFGAMAALLVVALCVPEAFGDRALTFAIAYGIVRAGHIALFVLASRDDPSLRHSVWTLATSTAARRRPARGRVVPRRPRAGGAVGRGDRRRLGRAGTVRHSRDGAWCRATSPNGTTW